MYNRKIRLRMMSLMCAAGLLAGCGAAEDAKEAVPVETAESEDMASSADAETSAKEENGTAGETDEASEESETAEKQVMEDIAPDPTNLEYLEEYQIADVYGDGKEYPLYAPKGGQNTDGFFYFDEHGVTFTASVYSTDSQDFLQMYLDEMVKSQAKSWQEDPEYSEVGVGEMLEKGDDRYLFLTAKTKDYNGTPYQRTKLCYMSVRDGGAGVFWDMEVREYAQDEETAPLIQEVARCYGLNLRELAMDDGAWSEQNAQFEADRQDVYEPEEGEPVLEKVEGYQYLGMLTLALDEEGDVTCPVLVPMGWNTTAKESRVSTTIHGVSVWVEGYETGSMRNYQAMAQEDADTDLNYYNNPEYGYRNGKVSKVMPMSGQEAAVYYTVTYEQQDTLTEAYFERTYVKCLIQVKEKNFVICELRLKREDYDSATNDLLRELETAYGIDLSAWYAAE